MRGNCDCCERKDVELRRTEVTGIETYACAVCHGEDADTFDDDCKVCGSLPLEDCKPGCECESCMAWCICTMSSVNSASIDPPEPIRNRNCPVHGSPVDPSDAYKARATTRSISPTGAWETNFERRHRPVHALPRLRSYRKPRCEGAMPRPALPVEEEG